MSELGTADIKSIGMSGSGAAMCELSTADIKSKDIRADASATKPAQLLVAHAPVHRLLTRQPGGKDKQLRIKRSFSGGSTEVRRKTPRPPFPLRLVRLSRS